jgi:hypothetical protein
MTIKIWRKKNNETPKLAIKYGSEAWILRSRDRKNLEAAHMWFLRPVYEWNGDLKLEMKI